MKKTILSVFAVLTFGILAAQTTPPADTRTKQQSTTTTQTTTQKSFDVPASVNQRFNTDYPNMRSTWSRTDNGYRAEYSDPNSRLGRAVIYDMDGNPMGTEREIIKGEYPSTINNYFSSNYPNEQYRVWNRDDNGKTNYYVSRKDEIIWFDDKGSYNRKSSHMMNDKNQNRTPDMK